jgi:hypothetical protein
MSFKTIKFFEPDVQDAPTASTSIASLMATKGTRVAEDSTVEVPPIVITEKKEETETPAVTSIPADTATLAETAETAKPATPTTPKVEIPEVVTPQKEETTVTSQWQTVLKNQKPDDVLKELGYDEKVVNFLKEAKTLDPKMVAFLEHWKNNGDVKAYLSALSTDFKTMKPEEVMRHQLREANPELDARQLETLYKIKVTNRYKLDPEIFSEEEVEEGRVELMSDAKPIRAALAQEQEKLFIPQPPAKEPQVDVYAEQQRKEAESRQEIKNLINADPFYREVLANGKLKIGEGDEAFNYPMKNPEEAVSILYDNNRLAAKLFDENGLPNMKLQLAIAALIEDDDKFFKANAKHYKSVGGKSAIEPIENPKLPGSQPSAAPLAYNSMAEAMAKAGRMSSGDE